MAMVRNLAKMTAVGLLTPGSEATKTVRDRLADGEHLRKSRLHPLAILLAAATYTRGRGLKGSLSVGAGRDAQGRARRRLLRGLRQRRRRRASGR